MSPTTCDLVHRFADGELSDAEAAEFREHLATCAACERALHDIMMLEALGSPKAALSGGGGNVRKLGPAARKRPRVAPIVVALLPLAAAAAWAIHAGLSPRASSQPVASNDAPLETSRTRSLEARLSYADADRYRTRDVARGSSAAREAVPLGALAALESRGDLHGVAAGLMLAGELDRASQFLDRAWASQPTVDVEADRAALALARGRTSDALGAFDRVLAKNPKHPQALFNRAIVLRELGLRRASAEAFDRVAELGEPGWSDEARADATALRAAYDASDRAWTSTLDAGKAMVDGGPPLGDEAISGSPDYARHYFNHALRAATSQARAMALLPLAQTLDARVGGHALEDQVHRAATRDFAKRAPLARTYARLVASESALSDREKSDYLAALRAAGDADMLLGAIPLAGMLPKSTADYARLADASGDPWFIATARRAEAQDDVDHARFAQAEQTLRAAVASCPPALGWGCARLEYDLSWLLDHQARRTDAEAAARAGLERVRASAFGMQGLFVQRLAYLARVDEGGALLRAYAREAELDSPDSCSVKRNVHEMLAMDGALRLDAPALEAELDLVPRCQGLVSLITTDLTVTALRMGGSPAGAATFLADLQTERAQVPPGDRLSADVIEARYRLLSDPPAGEALARHALDEAARQPASDVATQKAVVYARLTLAVETARTGRAGEALEQIAAGAGAGEEIARASGCALGLAVDDERALAVTRDAGGSVVADLTARTVAAITPDALVSSAVRARLAGCPDVRVFALAPIHGVPELLPPDVAWAYASSTNDPTPAAAPAPAHRVVISDVTPPASLGLAQLGSWSAPSDGVTWLHGESATPGRTLEAIADATEIEIHAHGFVDEAQSTASLIALSPDATGRYALSAADLAGVRLRGRPVVVLGACHAAKTAASLHEAWSLPNAFVHAGARAVFASPAEIRDAEAHPFFEAVLARVRAGAKPSVALRDERTAWLARDPSSWVVDVIAFE